MASRVAKPMLDRTDSRKRVFKACERCRIKKIKCEGVSPCQRCLAEDGICVFGRRRQGLTRMVTSGYVENLEMQQRVLTKALKAAWKGANPENAGNLPVHAILEELGLLQGLGGPNSLRASFESLDKTDDSDEACIETHTNHTHGETFLDDSTHCDQSPDHVHAENNGSFHDHVTESHPGNVRDSSSYTQPMGNSWNGQNESRTGRQYSNLSTEPPPLSWRDSSSTISTVPSIPSPTSTRRKQSSSSSIAKSPLSTVTSPSSFSNPASTTSMPAPRRRSSQKPTFCPMPPKPVFPPHLQPVIPQQPTIMPSTTMAPDSMSIPKHQYLADELNTMKQETSTAEWAQQLNMDANDADTLMAGWPPNAMDLDLDLDLEDGYPRRTFSDWLGALQ